MTTVVAMSPEGGQKFPRGLHDVYWGITPPFQEPSLSCDCANPPSPPRTATTHAHRDGHAHPRTKQGSAHHG